MNTPPPESEFPKMDPLPSLSMPTIQPPNAESSTPLPPPVPSTNRRRRHTINRPDAALALLSESDEGETDDQTLDRISGILSNLIQEANEAVQNNGSTTPRKRPNSSTLMKDRRRHSMYAPSQPVDSAIPCRSKSISRLPRPTRQQQHNYAWIHDHPSSGSSSSTFSMSLFPPTHTTASSSTSSSVEQQPKHGLEYLEYQSRKVDDEDGVNDRRITSNATPLIDSEDTDTDDTSGRGDVDVTDDETGQIYEDEDEDKIDDESQHGQQNTALAPTARRHMLPRSDPLIESLRRLDTSMALVESLSRDLAEEMQQTHHTREEIEEIEETTETAKIAETTTTTTTTTTASSAVPSTTNATEKSVRSTSIISSTSTSKLTLLLLPLLHIPHALITTVFDTLTTPGSSNTTTWNFSSPSPSSTSTSSFVNHPSSTSPSSLSGMIAWTFFFALANMVISWSGVSTPHDFIQQQQQQRLPPSPSPRQSHSDQRPRASFTARPRRLSLPGSYRSTNTNSSNSSNSSNSDNDGRSTMFIMNTSNSNSRIVRFKRPAPINTTLCVKKSSSSTYSVRRTTTTTTTTSTIKRTTSKKRLDNEHHRHHHHRQQQQQQQQQQKQQQLRQLQHLQRQVQQARRLSSTYMDASKHSNDTSFTLAIQRSRIWKQQQHLRHQRLRKPDYMLKKTEHTRKQTTPQSTQQQRYQHDPLWTHHRRYSF